MKTAMKAIAQKLSQYSRNTTAAFGASLFCLSPAMADDTDIFFGTNSNLDVYPNVLLVVDTSGSMDWDTDPVSNNNRIGHVKEALRILINDLNNVNVGLMRFSNPGGPVLYPVSPIDGDVAGGGHVAVVASLGDGEDDAMESVSTTVFQNDTERLYLPEMRASGFHTATFPIDHASGDALENRTTFNNAVNTHDLEFLRGNNLNVGLRFGNTDIPRHAQILDARIMLFGRESPVNNSDPVYVEIVGERDEADAWHSDGHRKLTDRIDTPAERTTNTVEWTITDEVEPGRPMQSVDVSSIVQEIVNLTTGAGWNSHPNEENDISFILSPQSGMPNTGERIFHTYNSDVNLVPRLVLDYLDPGVADTVTPSQVGVRFTNVRVPKNATIVSAHISFTTSRAVTEEYAMTIAGERSDAPEPYTSSTPISGRTYYGATVAWNGTDDVQVGRRMDSADITSIVQAQVNESNWCGGNELAYKITGTTGNVVFDAFDLNSVNAAKLHVVYDHDSIPAGGSCYSRIESRRANATMEDVQQWVDGGASQTNSTANVLRLDSDDATRLGLRFRNIRIRNSMKIKSARLELVAARDQDVTSDVTISIEDSATAVEYDASNPSDSVSSRTYYGTTVPWTLTGNVSAGFVYQSPDITSLVQHIIDRSDWVSGGALMFQVLATGGTGELQAVSFDSSPGQSPRLVIEYENDGTSPERSVRDVLLEQVDGLTVAGYTPVQDTYYEAVRYLMGESVHYGKRRGNPGRWYTRVSHEDSMVPGTFTINTPAGCPEGNPDDANCIAETITGAGGSEPTYSSPITHECHRNNHIIMLTDGEANSPHSAALYPPLMGGRACANLPSGRALYAGERCVKTMADYIHTTDLAPTLAGNQIATTHTVGFSHSSQWLADVAAEGGGTYNESSTASALVAQINDIVVEALKSNTTFVAPVATVNQFDRMNHLNQIYFALFRPDDRPRWPGNVKRYKLGAGNTIKDQNDADAVDSGTGFFKDTSQSFWSSAMDGNVIDQGGAAENVPAHGSRKVYTYYTGSPSLDLTHAKNALVNTNTDLTPAMFGVGGYTTAQFQEFINWIRGKDIFDEDGDGLTTDTRYPMGDPLHSRPVAITYDTVSGSPDVELFFGTNGGGLHSVRGDTGVERFVFIPEEVYGIQEELSTNTQFTPHPYGMDGRISAWVNDNGNNGIDTTDPDDFVYIYTGMRRGGRTYFALDVTNRDAPKLLWKITGGAGAFGELGQSWAEPVKAKVKIDTEVKDVLILSGGYDADEDASEQRREDTMGRAIYMVDAKTGALLWSGGLTGAGTWNESFADMKYSFPSAVTAGDVDGDGLVDSMFAADTGGQLWRFDVFNGSNASDLVTGGVIADLGPGDDTVSVDNSRRFFHTPSVALRRGTNGAELAVAVGSGFRPSPLKTLATNRMFMVRQKSVFSAPSSYTRLKSSDLYDATRLDSVATPATLAAEKALLEAADGWYYTLPYTAEKVLSSPLITQDSVVFTTYQPGASASSCVAAAGVSRVYQIGLSDAKAIKGGSWGSTDTADPDRAGRGTELASGSIVDDPTTICTEGQGCTTFIGAESPLDPISVSDRMIKTYWRKEE